MYNIIQKRKIWLSLSGALVALSLVALLTWGLNFGIDFTGGSLLEVRFPNERPSTEEVKSSLEDMELGSLTVQGVDEAGLILRFQDISEEKHQEIISKLNSLISVEDISVPLIIDGENIEDLGVEVIDSINKVDELRFDSVGPSIGQDLKKKSVLAVIFVLLAIIFYISWAFRKVSKPVSSWKYGFTAIITLFHDVIITMGVFVILGEFFGVEVNTPFVAALLTVLGYSVNDTIVVFDRIRENLPKSEEDFENTINKSVNQTITRSINTSLTTIVVLLAIVFFGGATIQSFALALAIGVGVGTYSSIFLASPLLVIWEKLKNRD